MSKADYYDVLGVAKGAGPDELKRAYRKLAMQYHPDRNNGDGDAEKKFKEINEAYDVLKDEQKRAAYDQFGHAAFEGGGPGGRGGAGFSGFGTSGFADIFDEMFGDFMGGGRRRGGQVRGEDLRYNLEISLEDAFAGREMTIRVPSSVACESCSGTGAEGAADPTVCTNCRGTGNVRMQQGFFTIQRTCPSCNGQGRVIKNPCRTCSGSGRVRKEKTLQVNIPAGVDDGTRIRLTGEGEIGPRGGSPGDLYIFIAVAPHRLFKRDGSDLYCNVPLPMVDAALGKAIEVPTIDGSRARVTIPEGTQSGTQFRLRSKGMTALRSQVRGDMYVQISVETPRNLTKHQRELLREFSEGGEETTSPESSGFFERVKEFLHGKD